MIRQEKVSHLLSPPTSPRMSGTPLSQPNANWQGQTHHRQRTSFRLDELGSPSSLQAKEDTAPSQQPSSEGRPQLLRSHKTFPYPSSGAHNFPHQQSPLSRTNNPGSLVFAEDTTFIQGHYAATNRSNPVLSSHGGSTPPSPNAGLSPTSADADLEESNEEGEDEAGVVMSDDLDDDPNGEGGGEKTAAERRAEKRKMKRFRLTHNQTRFLMSEFTRQAHPDAAQRERLSKEIPGLSPRQVQVWFQNRRAKLKRLTSDDRERMLKSRALPEDFDMTQALHSPYGGQHAVGTPLASPVTYLPYADGAIRPLMNEGLRRQSEDDSTTSPISLGSTYGNFFTPPGSAPGSENLSPVSTTSDRTHFNPVPHSQNTSPRNSNPFIRSSSFSTAYHTNPHIPRLQMQDRMVGMGRSRAESLSSPLRSSMSYSGNALGYGENPQMGPNYDIRQLSEHQMPQPVSDSAANPYGLGHQNPQYQGFQSSALARGRPLPGPFPSGLQIRHDYSHGTGLATPQNPHSTFSGLQSAPLAAPQDYNIQHSDTYLASSFGGPYPPDHAAHSSSTLSLPLHLSHIEGGTEHQGNVESGNPAHQPPFGPGTSGQYPGNYDYRVPQQ